MVSFSPAWNNKERRGIIPAKRKELKLSCSLVGKEGRKKRRKEKAGCFRSSSFASQGMKLVTRDSSGGQAE